jgi:rod shape determining protein RodA
MTSYSHIASGRSSNLYRGYHIDWVLLFSTLLTILVGVLIIHSTEIDSSGGYVLRQVVAAFVGFMGLVFLMVIPYQVFRTYIKPIYLFMIFILIAVLFLGVNLRGTRGWFRLGPVFLQSSEVAKPLFVLTLAGFLDQRIQWYTPKSLVVPFMLACIPIGLILIQPDFSSSLVYFPITLVMFYAAGARTLHLLSLCFVGGLSAGIPLLSTYFSLLGEKDKPQ